MMVYYYANRVIVEYSDKTRASYSNCRYGTLLEEIIQQTIELDYKIYNSYKVENEVTKIRYFSQKENRVLEFLVDTEIFFEKELWKYYWTPAFGQGDKCRVFTRNANLSQQKWLAWYIMDFSTQDYQQGYVIDHINHDCFDNRKSNLRKVTITQNNTNLTNQLDKGVTAIKENGKIVGWRARVGRFFEQRFYGENAYKKAKQVRLQKLKEFDYLCYKDTFSNK